MKVGVNLLPIRKELTGIGVYAYNILNELLKLDNENSYIFFLNRDINDIFKFHHKRHRNIIFPFSARNFIIRIFFEQFILPFKIQKLNIKLLFSPATIIPIFASCKNIVCIHDMIPFHLKGKFGFFRLFYVKQMIKISAKRSDKIFTVSNNSKKEIIELCNVNETKVAITPNGINVNFEKVDNKKWVAFKEQKKIPKRYILYVGTLEPGKNVEGLIKAFSIFKNKYKNSYSLVIAGKKGWMYNGIFTLVKELNLDKEIIFTDFVPDCVLKPLYQNADAFIFLSLYEGFGLPIIEAMSCGIPVIASNNSSIPEILMDSGILVDPYNFEDIAEKINLILSNKSLRNELAEKGKLYSQNYSWENAAYVAYSEIKKVIDFN